MILNIDDKQVKVAAGATVLQAARQAGVAIPTLCHREGVPPFASCQVCLVRDLATGRLVPSCSYPAADGMRIDASSEDVRTLRRMMLELLVSEHVGDCEGPCRRACPAHMDIPEMERRIAADDWDGAVAVVAEHIPLPSILGRVCPAPCEKACRRGKLDTVLPICEQKRLVGDYNLSRDLPLLPPCQPDSGKRVAVVGAGPAGLSAAFYLRRSGHAVIVYDLQEMAGGALLDGVSEDVLPRRVIQGEAGLLERMGVQFRFRTLVMAADSADVGTELATVPLGQLSAQHDAALLAVGGHRPDAVAEPASALVAVEGARRTFATGRDGLFRCGGARPPKLAVAAVASGRRAALVIHQWLATGAAEAPRARFDSVVRDMDDQEVQQLLPNAAADSVCEDRTNLSAAEAQSDAGRCLHCDCAKTNDCRLRELCDAYGVSRNAVYRETRPPVVVRREHGEVVYEPGKCIKCGLCVRIAEQAGEQLGLSFVGRGFDIRIDGALNSTLAEALETCAQVCIEACPTAALAKPC